MPRLSDAPIAIRRIGPREFAKRIWLQIGEDNLLVWAAALAYSWLFAIFPFFIFLMTLVPYLPIERSTVRARIGDAIVSALPKDAYEVVLENVDSVLSRTHNGLMSIGLVMALWAASGGMNSTMAALNACYDVKENRPFWKQRLLAVVLTGIVVSLILAVVVLLPVAGLMTRIFTEWPKAWQWLESHGIRLSTPLIWLWNLTRWLLALMFLLALVSVVYHFGPRIKQRFRVITPGSVFTIAVWIALGLGFRVYVERFGKYSQTYGTIGGVVVLLTILYIDSVVFLIGAEINSEIDYALLSVPLKPEAEKPKPDIPPSEVETPSR